MSGSLPEGKRILPAKKSTKSFRFCPEGTGPFHWRGVYYFFVSLLLVAILLPATIFAQSSDSIVDINKKLGCLLVDFENDDTGMFLVRLAENGGYSTVLDFGRTLARKRTRARKIRKNLRSSRSNGFKTTTLQARLSTLRAVMKKIRECRDGLTDFSGLVPRDPSSGDGALPLACDIVGDRSQILRIINGDQCSIGNSPVVKIAMYDRQNFIGNCTGTVIDRRAVLTAAHCLPVGVQSVDIIVSGNTRYSSRSFAAHPAYNDFSSAPGANDVGIILLDRDLPTRVAGMLAQNDMALNEPLLIAGYGLIDLNGSGQSNGSSTNGLQAGYMSISSVSTREVIARFDINDGGANTCNGDSGGPAFVRRNGEWIIAAVTSYGFNLRCGPTDTSGFANITSSSVRDFLAVYLGG